MQVGEKTLLIVDDEPAVLKEYVQFFRLTYPGLNVITAENQIEGLEEIKFLINKIPQAFIFLIVDSLSDKLNPGGLYDAIVRLALSSGIPAQNIFLVSSDKQILRSEQLSQRGIRTLLKKDALKELLKVF